METANIHTEKSSFLDETTDIQKTWEMECETSHEVDHSVPTNEQTALLKTSSGGLCDPGSFQVNRRQIEEVSLSEQETELQALGLHVYDLDTLEQGILQQVDQALEEQEKKKLENEIQNINSSINCCEEQIHRSSSLLKALEKINPDQKKTISIKKNIENLQKQLTTLNVRLKSVQQKESCEILADDINTVESNILKKSQETERERKIRLGEMTPFGSVIESKSLTGLQKDAGFSDFKKYLERQAELARLKKPLKKKKVQDYENDTEEGKTETKKQRSPLKKSVLMPKKRRKKEKLGTRSSEEWWDQRKKPGKLLSETTAIESSGSEYLPSEDESEGEFKVKLKKFDTKTKPRRKVKRRLKPAFVSDSLEEWKTDDSDWEYSDEESRSRRRKKSKKEIDDGNIEDYHERLKLWEEQKLPEDNGVHELEGGYKMPKTLWSKLYKYQKVGVQWLWELNQQRCGGVLGDEMGLGKTVQVIAFLAGLSYSKLMSRQCGFRGLGPCLIVCPTTVMHQWVREFHTWWPRFRVAILHESGSFYGKREALIGQMRKEGCILVTSYIGAVQNQERLVAKDWHYVILDEGHKIRNPDAQVTLAVKQFRTPHRIILSGSPMQNNLKELWSLFDFVFPGKLGTLPVFLAQMAVPITQGGYANASQVQVATAYRCATVLRDTIAPFLLRRMKADVKSHIHLPSKNEQVLFCCLTEEQRELYKGYLDSGEVERILQGRAQVFVGLINLRKICNHPDLYSGGPKLLRHEKEEDLPEESRYGYWRKAGKMIVVESLLRIWHKQGHRVLLFTQSRQMMCILESFVQKCEYTYLKLDGGTGIGSRQPLINKFNEDPSYFLFLLTTRVGGLGINLTGADRVVIYDPDWNPATDTQARERAWRIGQQKQVTIYRLVTAGTIEEKIYHRQIFKQFLTNKVLKDPRQRRFFKSNDLLELFTLAESERTTETAAIFAGTGSEVKLKLNKKSKMKELLKKEPVKKDPTFPMSKLERMKQLAQQLSKKIAKEKSSEATKITGTEHVPNKMAGSAAEKSPQQSAFPINEGNEILKCSESVTEHTNKRTEMKDLSPLKCTNNSSFSDSFKLANETVTPVKKGDEKSGIDRKKHKHKHKHKRKKGIIFEGERVDYLLGQAESQKPDPEEHAQQDDYVLRKLLKTTGVQTAMKHDMIMESGDPDYALVEGEAQRVAKEAVRALKESRRQCWQAGTGVPTWTGQSGSLRTITTSAAKPRFGKKKPSTVTNADSSQQPMASTELLSRMHARNRLLEPLEEEQEVQTERTAQPSSSTMGNPTSEENLELLTDIRNFVAFGASVDGRATTQEIVDHFKERLPPGSSPLFKFLLSEVCEFHRMPSGEGVWKLRSEFQW